MAADLSWRTLHEYDGISAVTQRVQSILHSVRSDMAVRGRASTPQ
jgi:hypothetical protein